MEEIAETQGILLETALEELTILPIRETVVVVTTPTTGRLALPTLIEIQPIQGRIPLTEAQTPTLDLRQQEVVETPIRDPLEAPLEVVAVLEVQVVEVVEDNF